MINVTSLTVTLMLSNEIINNKLTLNASCDVNYISHTKQHNSIYIIIYRQCYTITQCIGTTLQFCVIMLLSSNRKHIYRRYTVGTPREYM